MKGLASRGSERIPAAVSEKGFVPLRPLPWRYIHSDEHIPWTWTPPSSERRIVIQRSMFPFHPGESESGLLRTRACDQRSTGSGCFFERNGTVPMSLSTVQYPNELSIDSELQNTRQGHEACHPRESHIRGRVFLRSNALARPLGHE